MGERGRRGEGEQRPTLDEMYRRRLALYEDVDACFDEADDDPGEGRDLPARARASPIEELASATTRTLADQARRQLQAARTRFGLLVLAVPSAITYVTCSAAEAATKELAVLTLSGFGITALLTLALLERRPNAPPEAR